MSLRNEKGFNGAKLVGAQVDEDEQARLNSDVLDNVTVPADATNGVEEGTLQETITALAERIKALEDAAA